MKSASRKSCGVTVQNWETAMRKIRSVASILAAVIFCAIAASGAVAAEADWPNRSVRVIIPWAVGGGSDPLARVIFDDLAIRLGQPFPLEFRPGASGTIGAAAFAKSRPDGYTVLFTTGPPAVNANFMPNVAYDPKTDILPVVQVVSTPSYIVAYAKTPYNTFRELIEYAKANPGKVNAAISGIGSQSELNASLVQYKTGVKFQIVPYGGAGAQLANLMAGTVDLGFGLATGFLSAVKSGKLKFIASLSAKRFANLPDVPASDESPYKGIHDTSWFVAFVPKGTPRTIIDKMNAEIRTTINKPGVKEKIEGLNYEIMTGSPEDAAALIKSDTDQIKKLLDAGVMKAVE